MRSASSKWPPVKRAKRSGGVHGGVALAPSAPLRFCRDARHLGRREVPVGSAVLALECAVERPQHPADLQRGDPSAVGRVSCCHARQTLRHLSILE